MKVAIIGANGQLGMDLMAAFRDLGPAGFTHGEINIEEEGSVKSALDHLRPDLVINTAAYHKVDDCENNPIRSFQVNALGAKHLARVGTELGYRLMHVSTDYVFDGLKNAPYLETDPTHPLNVYAVTKLAGEHLISSTMERYYVVRSSGLYGHNPCRAKGRNFIDTMLKLAAERPEIKVVTDEVLTPTYTHDLAMQMRALAETEKYGLYHATSNGSCSWFDFAREIFKNVNSSVKVTAATSKDFPSPVKRPSYSVLENAALKSIGMDRMPDWKDSLKSYFSNRGE